MDMGISRGDGVRIDLVTDVDVIILRYDPVVAASVAVMISISSWLCNNALASTGVLTDIGICCA